MNLFIDGGGTSTKVYIKNDKEIITKSSFDGVNPQTFEQETLRVLKQIYNFSLKYDIQKIYLGMPGIEQYKNKNKIYDIFESTISRKNIFILTDIDIQELLFCDIDEYLAISLGSGTVIKEKTKNDSRILSSFGPFFGDEGSAFSFSCRFIREAIREKERKNYNSNFIKYTLIFFEINDIERLKELYSDWNNVKPKLLNFAKFILLENYSKLESEIEFIYNIISDELENYINKLVIDKNIEYVYLFGGMLQNNFFREKVTSIFKQKGLKIKN